MHTKYSPYDLLAEANRLISECVSKEILPKECEKQVVSLLNTAESNPNMSSYQLSLAHRDLADLYGSLGITGSALEHYEIALRMNPRIAVKKKMKQLKSLPAESLVYSLDANIGDEPDYSSFKPRKIELDTEFIEHQKRQAEKQAAFWNMSVEEYNCMYEKAREELQIQAKEEDSIYDPEWEKEIKERLSRLGEHYMQEFYQKRESRNDETGILSSKELDRLTLEAMERSFYYHEKR